MNNNENIEYDANLILKVVPQRYPFLMIDKILSHDLGKTATCLKNITYGEELLTGHFPENPIYPGVMLIEMGLQTTQVLFTDLNTLDESDDMSVPQGKVLKIEEFKFLNIVLPGDVLSIKATYVNEMMGMKTCKILITNQDNKKIAKGKVVVSKNKDTGGL